MAKKVVATSVGSDEAEKEPAAHPKDLRESFHHSPLHKFQQHTGVLIEWGMFFFGLGNAGVSLSSDSTGMLSVVVFLSLICGKIIGIFMFGMIANEVGFSLPIGVEKKHLLVLSLCCGLGLTVALFVSGVAYPDPVLQAQSKLGALLSVLVAPIAFVLGKILRVKDVKNKKTRQRKNKKRITFIPDQSVIVDIKSELTPVSPGV